MPTDWNAFIFVLEGVGRFGSLKMTTESGAHHTLVLTKGESVYFKNEKNDPLRFVLIAGQPLNEPIVQHGPFVMNTEKEIHEAFEDYNFGKNGFEKAVGWKSQSGNKR